MSIIAESSDDTLAETAVVLRDQAQRVKREHDLPLVYAVVSAGIECKAVGGDEEFCSRAVMQGLGCEMQKAKHEKAQASSKADFLRQDTYRVRCCLFM